MPALDVDQFEVGDAPDTPAERIAELPAEHRRYLAAFEDLDAGVREAVY